MLLLLARLVHLVKVLLVAQELLHQLMVLAEAVEDSQPLVLMLAALAAVQVEPVLLLIHLGHLQHLLEHLEITQEAVVEVVMTLTPITDPAVQVELAEVELAVVHGQQVALTQQQEQFTQAEAVEVQVLAATETAQLVVLA